MDIQYCNNFKRHRIILQILYLFLRADPDLMFGLLDALLSAGDGHNLAVVGYSGHAYLGGSNLFQIFQFLPQLAQNPAVVFFRYRDLLASL